MLCTSKFTILWLTFNLSLFLLLGFTQFTQGCNCQRHTRQIFSCAWYSLWNHNVFEKSLCTYFSITWYWTEDPGCSLRHHNPRYMEWCRQANSAQLCYSGTPIFYVILITTNLCVKWQFMASPPWMAFGPWSPYGDFLLYIKKKVCLFDCTTVTRIMKVLPEVNHISWMSVGLSSWPS